MSAEFDQVWARIVRLAGSEFRQKTGRRFTFSIRGGALSPDTTNRLLARSQFERAYYRRPLKGPGQLQDLQGPSYLYAILTDPRVNGSGSSTPRSEPELLPSRLPRERTSSVPMPSQSANLPTGTPATVEELTALGFQRLSLKILRTHVQGGQVIGCDWDTVGDVPDAAGLYLFTLHRDNPQQIRVTYAGMTTHLWMVTKGHLPRGAGARGGQRYGRPQNAGATRVRVNGLVTRAVADGWIVCHWVSPFSSAEFGSALVASLQSAEEKLISRWNLRKTGWNRG